MCQVRGPRVHVRSAGLRIWESVPAMRHTEDCMLVYRAYGSERVHQSQSDQGGHRERGGSHDDEGDERLAFPEAGDRGDEHGALRTGGRGGVTQGVN